MIYFERATCVPKCPVAITNIAQAMAKRIYGRRSQNYRSLGEKREETFKWVVRREILK
jgi:hypothetical protein